MSISLVNFFRVRKIRGSMRSVSPISGRWKKAQTERPSGTPVLSITVRNLGVDGRAPTEKTLYNWRAAWEMVDKALWPRRQTQVYVTDLPAGSRPSRYRGWWFIDFVAGKGG